MASETTPLVSTPRGSPAVYFLDGARRSSRADESSDAVNPGRAEVDMMPRGGVAAEFDSRPVSGSGVAAPKQRRHMRDPSVGGGWQDYVPDGWKNAESAGVVPVGGREDITLNAGGIGTLVLPRKMPLKLEPKVYFANERTFLAWLHVVLILAAASLTFVTFSTDENIASQLYGIVLLPVSVAYIFYALWQYLRRSRMIDRREPGPFIDVVGPTTLTVIIMASITAQFCLKLQSVVYSYS